jgi:hypothetical protein
MLYNTRSLLKIALRTIYSRVCLARQSDMSPKLDGSAACISPARRIFCVRSFIPTRMAYRLLKSLTLEYVVRILNYSLLICVKYDLRAPARPPSSSCELRCPNISLTTQLPDCKSKKTAAAAAAAAAAAGRVPRVGGCAV